MSGDNVLTYTLTFVGYFAIVLGLGYLAWKRTVDLADYILGGRGLGKWVTALSAQASDMSGWLLMGLPGFAYAAGMESLWLPMGLLVGTYLNWKLVAERLRRRTEVLNNSLTIPDYLEQRFEDGTRTIRIISAVLILVFFTFYTSSGLVAGGKLFEEVFGFPYYWAVTTGALVVLAYTFVGGFFAVSWTDALQGSLMFFALVIVLAMGLGAVGGVDGLTANIGERNPNLLSMMTDADGNALTWIAIVSSLGWGLGYVGQPHILARFMAIRNADHMARSRHIAVTWQTVALIASTTIGIIGLAYLETPLTGDDTEKVFMRLTEVLLHPVVAGIALAAILAAVMSTADSQLLVASSAVSEDFYKGVFKRDARGRELLWVGRGAVVAIAVLAYLLALDPKARVLELVAYAWAGFGAGFGPTIVLSLYWKRMNLAGAIAGVAVGGGTVIAWDLAEKAWGGVFELYEMVPGFALSLVAIVVATLATSRRSA